MLALGELNRRGGDVDDGPDAALRELGDHRDQRDALRRIGALVDDDRRADLGPAPPISWMPRFASPDSAATTDRPSSEMPLKLPRSTFQASTACLPTVSASLLMMQPPVKTSAVRASTYLPLIDVPARSDEPDKTD